MSLVGVYLELAGRCGHCAHRVPVNGCMTHTQCAACNAPLEVPPLRWKTLLENLVAPDAPLGMTSSMTTLPDQMHLDHGREDPKCAGCGTAFPVEIAALAARGFAMCGGCGKKTSVRTPPPELAEFARGATLVIGENLEQLAPTPPRAKEPVSIRCSNCHAPLQLDGKDRRVRCEYCSTDTYLPDDVWLRLHPVASAQRFYLAWTSREAAVAAQRKVFTWYQLRDARLGADGNLYCLGDGDHRNALWCMSPDGRIQWTAFPFEDGASFDTHSKLALDPSGRVYVHGRDKHSLTVHGVPGGTLLGKIGGKQPSDAKVRTLDAGHLEELVADVDGTLLTFIRYQLARFAPDGTPLETWPARGGVFGAKHEKLLPLYDADGSAKRTQNEPSIDHLAHYPFIVYGPPSLAVGCDGNYYLADRTWVAKLDRAGRVLYRKDIGKELQGRIGADAAGNAYLIASANRQRFLVRISADGKRVDTLATDHLHSGVLDHQDTLLNVARDGSTFHTRWGMAMRILAPDGRLVFISEPALADDARERAKAND